MVAIVSFPWFSRAAPTATSMAVDRPEAIDPHPRGPRCARAMGWLVGLERSGGRQGAAFLSREEWRRSGVPVALAQWGGPGRGRKPLPAVAGIRARRAKRDRPSVRPATSRTQVGVPVAKTTGMKARVCLGRSAPATARARSRPRRRQGPSRQRDKPPHEANPTSVLPLATDMAG